MKFKDMSYKELEKDFKEKLDQYTDNELVNSLSEMEDIKEKTANELFEELGYEKVFFRNDKLDYIIYSKNNRYSIEFHKNNKKILISHLITIEELQAINKKCKELGWI